MDGALLIVIRTPTIMHMILRLALLCIAGSLCAATREEKLVNALIQAQRRVEHAMERSEEAAAAAQAHCQGKGLQLGTAAQIARALKMPEDFVWSALTQLGRDGLLESKVSVPFRGVHNSRSRNAVTLIP